MSRFRSLVATAVIAAVGMLTGSRATAADLSVGDRAPEVALQGPDGAVLTLSDLLARGGREGIVLAWFPKAFTPG